MTPRQLNLTERLLNPADRLTLGQLWHMATDPDVAEPYRTIARIQYAVQHPNGAAGTVAAHRRAGRTSYAERWQAAIASAKELAAA